MDNNLVIVHRNLYDFTNLSRDDPTFDHMIKFLGAIDLNSNIIRINLIQDSDLFLGLTIHNRARFNDKYRLINLKITLTYKERSNRTCNNRVLSNIRTNLLPRNNNKRLDVNSSVLNNTVHRDRHSLMTLSLTINIRASKAQRMTRTISNNQFIRIRLVPYNTITSYILTPTNIPINTIITVLYRVNQTFTQRTYNELFTTHNRNMTARLVKTIDYRIMLITTLITKDNLRMLIRNRRGIMYLNRILDNYTVLISRRTDLSRNILVLLPYNVKRLDALKVMLTTSFLSLILHFNLNTNLKLSTLSLRIIRRRILMSTRILYVTNKALRVEYNYNQMGARPKVTISTANRLRLNLTNLARDLLRINRLRTTNEMFALTRDSNMSIVKAKLMIRTRLMLNAHLRLRILQSHLMSRHTLLNRTIGLREPDTVRRVIRLLSVPANLHRQDVRLKRISTIILGTFKAKSRRQPSTLNIIFRSINRKLRHTILLVNSTKMLILRSTRVIRMNIYSINTLIERNCHNVTILEHNRRRMRILRMTKTVFHVTIHIITMYLSMILNSKLTNKINNRRLTTTNCNSKYVTNKTIISTGVRHMLLTDLRVNRALKSVSLTNRTRRNIIITFGFNLTNSNSNPIINRNIKTTIRTNICRVRTFTPISLSLLNFTLMRRMQNFNVDNGHRLTTKSNGNLLINLTLVNRLMRLCTKRILPTIQRHPNNNTTLNIPIMRLLLKVLSRLTNRKVPRPQRRMKLITDNTTVTYKSRAKYSLRTIRNSNTLTMNYTENIIKAAKSCCGITIKVLRNGLLITIIHIQIKRNDNVTVINNRRQIISPTNRLRILSRLDKRVVNMRILSMNNVIITTLPTFRILRIMTTRRQNINDTTMLQMITGPTILLIITRRTRRFKILTLKNMTTMNRVDYPILRNKIMLITKAPFNNRAPTIIISRLTRLTNFPEVFQAKEDRITPRVRMSRIRIITSFLTRIDRATCAEAKYRVMSTISTSALVGPIPTMTRTTYEITTRRILTRNLNFQVRFKNISIRARTDTVLKTLFRRNIRIINTTRALTSVTMIQITKIITFVTMTLRRRKLTRTINIRNRLLSIIGHNRRQILHLKTRIRNSAPYRRFKGFLKLMQIIRSITMNSYTVLPISNAIFILITNSNRNRLQRDNFNRNMLLTLKVNSHTIMMPQDTNRTRKNNIADLLNNNMSAHILTTTTREDHRVNTVILKITPRTNARTDAKSRTMNMITVNSIDVFNRYRINVTELLHIKERADADRLNVFLTKARKGRALIQRKRHLSNILLRAITLEGTFKRIILSLNSIRIRLINLSHSLGNSRHIGLLNLVLSLRHMNNLNIKGLLRNRIIVTRFSINTISFGNTRVLKLTMRRLTINRHMLRREKRILLGLGFRLLNLRHFKNSLGNFIRNSKVSNGVHTKSHRLLKSILVTFLNGQGHIFTFFGINRKRNTVYANLRLNLVRARYYTFGNDTFDIRGLTKGHILNNFSGLQRILSMRINSLIRPLPKTNLSNGLIKRIHRYKMVSVRYLLTVRNRYNSLNINPKGLSIVLVINT